MDGIYKITIVGNIIAIIIGCLSARAFAEEAGTKKEPIVIDRTLNLIDNFSAESIRDATIDDEGESYSGEQWLKSDGRVVHPKWFEGDKLIKADRIYYLIEAENAPDYYFAGSAEFSDMTDIGNTESEENNKLEYVNASEPQIRNVDGRAYSYRTLSKNGAMAVNLKCAPNKINYLTVRLWGGDTGDTILWVCDPVSGKMNAADSQQPHRNASVVDRRDWVELNYVGSTPQYDGGFIYSTYEIPEIYTKNKRSVSLRLYSTGGPANYSNVTIKDQTEVSRGIYDVYMTQNPAFDPADYGSVDGRGDNKAENLYGISDNEAMNAQRAALKEAVLSGIDVLRRWQIYGDEVPEYMQGMITHTDAWSKNPPASESEWKESYYSANFMLRQNMTPLNMLELAAYAYNNSQELGLSGEEKNEMLDRAVTGIDFLCRAQGSNGGFYSNNGWIGGPSRKEAAGNNLTGFGLRSAGQCILDILDGMDNNLLNEQIDSDADGNTDKSRSDAWKEMLEKAIVYLTDPNGGYGHAPNQDMANSIAALRFNEALKRLGGNALSGEQVTLILDRCFGIEKNPVTSSYWVSPKGTVLENFGSVQGGYSGDYGSNAIVELSQLADIAYVYYGYDYRKYMPVLYDTIDKYYFTGKRAEGDSFLAQEYTEGLISNRNAYYPGTERYPIDVYSALELENDTALKIIANYLTQKDISGLSASGKELFHSNAHYEDNVLDAVYLYRSFNDIISAAEEREIDSYEFAMENESSDTFAWADEMARNVVIKDGDKRIYMVLNWRDPAHSTKIYSAGNQSVRANNLCRVHAVNDRYDSYGYSAMTSDGYDAWTDIAPSDGCMEALMSANYGAYTIIMNSYNCSGNGNIKNFDAEEFENTAGLDRSSEYKDMITGSVYAYKDGHWTTDDTVMVSEAASTMVLKKLDISTSRTVIRDGEASTAVYNNTGADGELSVYLAEYDEYGRLADIKAQTAAVPLGDSVLKLDMKNAQRIFIWDGLKPVN